MTKMVVETKLPPMMIDRPKMPRATWEGLRNHIMRERQRKKEEQEHAQEFERQRKEREHRGKREALTLEETKEQISQLEQRLTQLKEEKHQLFHTLKKVLYEDETRRRKVDVHPTQMYLQTNTNRPGMSGLYRNPHPQVLVSGAASVPQQTSLQAQERQRSPSPPRSAHSYYRSQPGPSTTQGSKYIYTTTPGITTTSTHVYAHPSSHPYAYAGALSAAAASRDEERGKHVYLSQTVAASHAARSAAIANYNAERLRNIPPMSAAAPPAAHGGAAPSPVQQVAYRTVAGSIYSNRYTSPAMTSASLPPRSSSPSARLVHPSQHQQQQHQNPPGGGRFYGLQREV